MLILLETKSHMFKLVSDIWTRLGCNPVKNSVTIYTKSLTKHHNVSSIEMS